MDRIPEEILVQIFSNLHGEEKAKARLVCQKWRRVLFTYSLTRREIFVLRKYRNLVSTYKHQTTFADSFQPVNINLVINAEDIQKQHDLKLGKKFWSHRGGNIRTLNINIATVHFEVLLDILLRCPILEHLTVQTDGMGFHKQPLFLTFFDGVSFENLISLDVKGDRRFLFPLLKTVITNASFLNSINFMCGTGWCSNSIIHRPFSILFNLRKVSTLKAIDVQCASINNDCIKEVTQSLGEELEAFSIGDSGKLTESALKFLEQRCKNLNLLAIGNWNFNCNYFRNTFFALKKLTVVSFFWSSRINNEAVASLGVLPCLAHLNISNCSNVTNEGISELFNKMIRPEIIELRFIQLRITDNLIKEIAPYVPNIKILNLSFCRQITTASLEAVATHNPYLQCLLIHGCEGVDSTLKSQFRGELPPFFNKMSNLKHLGAFKLEALTRACDKSLQLPQLLVLDYNQFCLEYTDLLNRCPSLKYVNSFCCLTKSHIDYNDTELMLIKRTNLLNCYKSPLGTCNCTRRIYLESYRQFFGDNMQMCLGNLRQPSQEFPLRRRLSKA